MISASLLLAAGIVLAGIGGDLFVNGAVGAAQATRLSPSLIGATVAAFAASSPELAVAVSSALADAPGVGLGNALGSNVVNVALILGVTLLGGSIRWSGEALGRDYPAALIAPAASAALFFAAGPPRILAVILLGGFCVWLATALHDALRQRRKAGEKTPTEGALFRAILRSVLGMAVLFAASRLIVSGALEIAQRLQLDPFVIGAGVAPLGTSVPELAAMIIARLKGEDGVAIGAVLGSNIFNSLLVVGTTLALAPVPVDFWRIAPSLAFGALTLLVIWPGRTGIIDGRRGAALLLMYAAYLVILWRGG